MGELLDLRYTLELEGTQLSLQTQVTTQTFVPVGYYYLAPSLAQLHLAQVQSRHLVLVPQVQEVVRGEYHHYPDILLGRGVRDRQGWP